MGIFELSDLTLPLDGTTAMLLDPQRLSSLAIGPVPAVISSRLLSALAWFCSPQAKNRPKESSWGDSDGRKRIYTPDLPPQAPQRGVLWPGGLNPPILYCLWSPDLKTTGFGNIAFAVKIRELS